MYGTDSSSWRRRLVCVMSTVVVGTSDWICWTWPTLSGWTRGLVCGKLNAVQLNRLGLSGEQRFIVNFVTRTKRFPI